MSASIGMGGESDKCNERCRKQSTSDDCFRAGSRMEDAELEMLRFSLG